MTILNDYIRLQQNSLQTWAACLQTISLRAALISTNSPWSTVVINENMKMTTEKIAASFEVYEQLQKSTNELYKGQFNPLSACEKIVTPINKKAVANARRLSGTLKK